MNKSSKKKVHPEQKLNSEQKADDKQVSPAIGNAPVIGGQVELRSDITIQEALFLLNSMPNEIRDFVPYREALTSFVNEKIEDGSAQLYDTHGRLIKVMDAIKGMSVRGAISLLSKCRERVEKESVVV